MPQPSTSLLRIGLVGCGAVARRHVEYLRSDTRARFEFLCDAQQAAAESLAAELGAPVAIENDFATALDTHAVDAVILCTPNSQHHPQTIAALERGLHVLCEKPLAITREQIREVMARQQQTQRIVSVAHQRRYLSLYSSAKQELADHAELYGPLRQVHLFTCERWAQGIAGTWRNDPRQNLGYFADAGIHQVDIVFYLSGQHPVRLMAASSRRDAQVEIATSVFAELSGGASLVAHHVGDAQHFREDIHFHFRDADLLLRGDQLLRYRDNKLEPVPMLVADSNPATAFVDAVLAHQPTITSPEIALPIFAWSAAVTQSIANQNAWVTVEL